MLEKISQTWKSCITGKVTDDGDSKEGEQNNTNTQQQNVIETLWQAIVDQINLQFFSAYFHILSIMYMLIKGNSLN